MSTQHSVLSSAKILAAFTLISRLLGLLREVIFAYTFGASVIGDAFALAFRIPNLARRLFGEGALSAAFIPALTQEQSKSEEQARLLSGRVLVLQVIILGGLCIIGEGILALAAQWTDDPVVGLTAIMLPYMICICAVAALAGIQNVVGRFASPALMPIVFNVCFICGILCAGQYPVEVAIYLVAVSIVLAGLLQVGWQWIAVRNGPLRPQFDCNFNDERIRGIGRAMMPMMLGLAAVQLNSFADLLIAKLWVAQEGAAICLSYAERLYQLPLGVVGAAIGTAIYPQLSRWSADSRQFNKTMQEGLQLALLLGVPASAGLWLVREPLVRVLFEHGAFSAEDTQRVAAITGWYGLGVWAYILQQVLVRAHYAKSNHSGPMKIAVRLVVLNVALNVIFVQFMQERGIAMATMLTAAIQVVWLAAVLDDQTQHALSGVLRTFVPKVLAGALFMSISVAGVMRLMSSAPTLNLVAAVIIGVLSYASAAWVLRILPAVRSHP